MTHTPKLIPDEDERIMIELDIHTVEDITTRYLMRVYVDLQAKIAEFIKERIHKGSSPIGDWEQYQRWHDDSESCRRVLISIMDYKDYSDFMERTYKRFYPK